MKKKKINILALIVFIALLLRLIGIKHGFPFIFHPDEPTIIRSALGVRFFPNPKHFDWPHLYIYLNYFVYMVFARVRNLVEVAGLRGSIPFLWEEPTIFYFITRCITAILGGLTVIPVYLSAKNIFNKKAGLLSALAFAFLPFHIWHSHYSLSDAPMVFLLAWAMYFGTKIFKEGKLSDYALTGLFVGLSASTKYNGGLSALVVPLAYVLRKLKDKQKLIDWKEISYIVLSGTTALAGFIAGTPYALLDFNTFKRTDGPAGALWQFTNVGSLSSSEHITNFISDLTFKLPNDLGFTVVTLFIACWFFVIYKIIKKKVGEKEFSLLLFLVLPLFYIWYISGFVKSRSHYYMIAYPFIAIVFGYCILEVSKFFKKKELGIALATVLMLVPIYSGFSNTYTFVRGDTRDELRDWLTANLSEGASVVYNDKNVADVIEDVGAKGYKGLRYLQKVDPSVVVVASPNENEIPGSLTEIYHIQKFNKLGPEIKIYRYEAN